MFFKLLKLLNAISSQLLKIGQKKLHATILEDDNMNTFSSVFLKLWNWKKFHNSKCLKSILYTKRKTNKTKSI